MYISIQVNQAELGVMEGGPRTGRLLITDLLYNLPAR